MGLQHHAAAHVFAFAFLSASVGRAQDVGVRTTEETMMVEGGSAPAAGAPPPPRAHPRKTWEVNLGLGIGDAFCDNDSPDSECPVDGAGTFYVGGGWRPHPHWSFGVELGFWGYGVNDEWRGELDADPDDVRFSSSYLIAYGRWYWLDDGPFDPYLHGGFGFGNLQGEAENANDTYETSVAGVVFPLGIGVDWQVAEVFRIGPQFLAYLHLSTRVCDTLNGAETCRDPGNNADGDREGNALPWRFALQGTFTFGDR